MSSLPVHNHKEAETDHPDITSNILSFYCQQMTKNDIPMDVIHVIKLFWSLGKIWSLDASIISNLYQLKYNQRYKLSTIKSYGAIFECNLFCDGFDVFYELCAVSIPTHPVHIKKMRIYFELSCISTKIKIQGTKTFKTTNKKEILAANKWKSKAFKVLKRAINPKYKQVQFHCFLDVLQIKFGKNDNTEKNNHTSDFVDYYKPLTLRNSIVYNFEAKTNKTKGFVNGDYIQSEPFGGGEGVDNVQDHCWWLRVDVIKTNKLDQYWEKQPDKLKIALRLFRIPEYFNELHVKCMIVMDNGKKIRGVQRKGRLHIGDWIKLGENDGCDFIIYPNIKDCIKFKLFIDIENFEMYQRILGKMKQSVEEENKTTRR